MKNMTVTASRLDKFLHFMSVFFSIGIGVILVGLALIAAFFLFHLDPSWIGSGYNELDLGILSLRIAQEYLPNYSTILLTTGAQLLMALVNLFLFKKLLDCFREILSPMKEGRPFHNTVSQNLKKSAVYVLIWGVLQNVFQALEILLVQIQYQLSSLLISDKVTHVILNLDPDLNFLLLAAILFLLCYVFRYGESLQQLSDETL